MLCTSCGFENPGGANFCGQCGTKFETKCQNCGKENPLTHKFCYVCGHRLSESAKVKANLDDPQSYIPKHLAEKILSNRASLEGERKQVTVLFADVSGFTALSEKLDPEDVRTIMNRCFEIIIEEVHRYEGIINQFTGDGVMSIFGAPVALEDHPYRAVNAALAIQRGLKKYGEELKKESGIDLRMRIGLNTGLVVVGKIGTDLRMDYTAMGDTTNLASRLETLAEPGTILIGDNTHRLIKDKFNTKSLGGLQVKGKEAPVKAYQVLSLMRSTTPLDIAKERGLTRFVGREKEIDTFKHRLTKAIEGLGQVVVIVGEPGLGKSRLIYEFRRSIDEKSTTYLEARCLSYGKSTPYLPVIELLKSNFRVEVGDEEHTIRQKFEASIKRMDPNLEWTLPYFYHLLSLRGKEHALRELDETEIKRRTYEAIKAVTLRGSQSRPLFFVIENVHWMDSASEQFLNYLVGSIARSSIMMVVSSRPGYVPSFTDKSYYTQITLSPLSDMDCDTMLKDLLKAENISAELRELVLSKCEGNPFYLEEVVKDFLEEGIIRQANGKYVLIKEASKLRVPGTIHNVIMSRIDRLDENLKKTLQYASVIGREFPLGLLKQITRFGEEIHEYLGKLKGSELIYEKGIYPEPEYLFKHALTQEATYNTMLLSKRRELHGSIGKVLEELHRERLEDYYETLAYHFHLGDNKEKALKFSTLAGDKSFRLHSTREAKDYYEKGIKLTEEMTNNRKNQLTKIDLTLKLVKALRFFESPEQTLRVLKEVEELARKLGDQKALAKILSSIGLLAVISGKNQEDGIKYGEQSLKLASRLKDDKLISSAYYSLSLAYYFTRYIPKTIEIIKKSYNFNKKTGDFFEASHCLLILGLSYWHGGNYVGGTRYLKEARKLAEERKAPTMVAHTYCGHGGYGLFYGNIKEGIEDCQRGMELFEGLGDLYYYLITSGCYWYGYYKTTGDKEAIKHLEGIIKTKEDKNMWIWQPMLYSYLSDIYTDLNELSLALEFSKKAIDIAQKAGNKLEEGRAWIALGNVYLKKKPIDWHNAEESFEESVKSFEKIGAKSGLGMSYYNLGAIYKDLGRNGESKRYLSKALAICEKAGLRWYLEKSTEALAEITNAKTSSGF
jgi:predicted ATPase/class 3 adenylate cyclase